MFSTASFFKKKILDIYSKIDHKDHKAKGDYLPEWDNISMQGRSLTAQRFDSQSFQYLNDLHHL